jgi:small subunit ribosomal protein S5
MGRNRRRNEDREELDERVIDITRVAKVIKGGRRFAFRTVVVVGDNNGRVGVGTGKARGVPDSIRKAADRARKNMEPVVITESGTIPYEVTKRHAGAQVMLKPASPGTGTIAGGAVRAVLEAAGVSDILTKSQGSNNMLNVAMATFEAMKQIRSAREIAEMRGKDVEDVLPFWEQAARYQQRQSVENVEAKRKEQREAQKEMTAAEVAASQRGEEVHMERNEAEADATAAEAGADARPAAPDPEGEKPQEADN